MPNQFDDLMPNTQRKNGGPFLIGTSDTPWDVIHSSSGVFDKIVIDGSIISGILSYEQSQFLGNLDGINTSYAVNHNLDSKYVDVVVYDSTGNKIIPNNIYIIDDDNLLIEFVEPQDGKILVQKGRST